MNVTPAQLDEAVRRNIITPAQRAELEALAAQPSAAGERSPGIVLAYAAGAVAVLFAFAWFLVERWERLGPGGVLALVLFYAVVFGVTAWWLAREGFPLGAAFASLLAVGMTPIATWAVLKLAGVWDGSMYARVHGPLGYGDEALPTRWALVELVTALAALLTWRRTRFAPLALPVAIAGWLAPLQLAAPFVEPTILGRMFGWGSLVTGAGLLLAAYAVDLQAADDGGRDAGLAFDAAGWVYRVAAFALFAGVVSTFEYSAVVRHGLPVLAAVAATFALAMGRRELLAGAAIAFVSYLGYLAFDVFEHVVSFPVLVATFGIVVILLTVIAQRRWPVLSARLAAARAGRRELPGGYAIPAGLLLVTALLLLRAPAIVADSLRREQRAQLRAIREAAEYRRREEAAGRPLPTKPVPPRPETPSPRAP